LLDLFQLQQSGLYAIEIDRYSRFLLTYENNQQGGGGTSALLYDIDAGRLIHSAPGAGASTAALSVSETSGSPFFALGYGGGDARLISLKAFEDGKHAPWTKAHDDHVDILFSDVGLTTGSVATVLGVAMTPDARRCVMICGMPHLLILDIDEIDARPKVSHFVPINKGIEDGHSVTISDDGLVAAACVRPGEVMIFDLVNFAVGETIRLDRRFPSSPKQSTVALSRPGDRLLIADELGDIHAFAIDAHWRQT
jgi:hypothetical protein